MASRQMCCGSQRPSSWPVRNERRHYAAAEHNRKVTGLLEEILQRLQSVESALSKHTLPVFAPPGLEMSALSDAEVGAGKMEILDRIEILEKVYVLTDWTALESACEMISTSAASRVTTNITTSSNTSADTEMFNIHVYNMDAAVQTTDDWKPLAKCYSKCSGPELGTLDEIDLLPPLLTGKYVTGQSVWTNTSLRLETGESLPPFSEGRILRQRDDNPASLWTFFEGDNDNHLVSVEIQHLEKVAALTVQPLAH